MDPKKQLKRKYFSDNPDESDEYYNPDTKKLNNKDSSKNTVDTPNAKRKFEENLSDDSADESSPKRKFNKESFSSTLANELTSVFNRDGVDKKFNEKQQPSTSSNYAAAKMMRKMGYQEGKGLGKAGQGIVKIVSESNQQGKHGLGFAVKNFDKRVESWDSESDPVSAYETPVWLDNDVDDVPALKELMKWKKIGKVLEFIDLKFF